MNILIIGNGFDLAHGLPTTYVDFLNFINTFENCEKRNTYTYIPLESEEKFTTHIMNMETDMRREFRNLIQDNIWISYFNKIYDSRIKEGKDGWVDFECEISKIIQGLDSDYRNAIKDPNMAIYPIIISNDNVCECLESYKIPERLEEFVDVHYQLLQDLNRITRALEIYLSYYVNALPVVDQLPDIKKLKIDKILSFNYTNTYERFYGTDNDKIEYDYIHGKAEIDHNINNCNLVLGIDEYLIGEERDKKTEFIQFKKFYQRIYKGTGCKYIDWLKQYVNKYSGNISASKPEDLNIYIFGHSLDVTDKDILQKFLLCESDHKFKALGGNIKITIFHFDQNALGKQIANLVKVIGQDNLISMTGGSDKKIILQQQKTK